MFTMKRFGGIAFVAMLSLALSGCDKNESEVRAKCKESFSGEVCDCIIETLNEQDAMEDVAKGLREGGVRGAAASTVIEGTALACRI